jgi:RimJ/RimL family protein N-acetyltransferase
MLRPMTRAAAAAILDDRQPPDVDVAPGYPTEFSRGIAAAAGNGSPLGPYFIDCDGTVVGEIGGGFVSDDVAEIGYAVVESQWGRGFATAAVALLVERARAVPAVRELVAHTPLDRPASGAVLKKAGFTPAGERDDEHEGEVVRVLRWELRVS